MEAVARSRCGRNGGSSLRPFYWRVGSVSRDVLTTSRTTGRWFGAGEGPHDCPGAAFRLRRHVLAFGVGLYALREIRCQFPPLLAAFVSCGLQGALGDDLAAVERFLARFLRGVLELRRHLSNLLILDPRRWQEETDNEPHSSSAGNQPERVALSGVLHRAEALSARDDRSGRRAAGVGRSLDLGRHRFLLLVDVVFETSADVGLVGERLTSSPTRARVSSIPWRISPVLSSMPRPP